MTADNKKKTTMWLIAALVILVLGVAIYQAYTSRKREEEIKNKLTEYETKYGQLKQKTDGINGILSGAGTLAGNIIKAIIMF